MADKYDLFGMQEWLKIRKSYVQDLRKFLPDIGWNREYQQSPIEYAQGDALDSLAAIEYGLARAGQTDEQFRQRIRDYYYQNNIISAKEYWNDFETPGLDALELLERIIKVCVSEWARDVVDDGMIMASLIELK